MTRAVNAPPSRNDIVSERPKHFATRGHDPVAARLLAALLATPPHALLIVGPRGAGAGTLARDAAAVLLCAAPTHDGACGTCRGCNLVRAESHADLAVVSPSGASDEIGIEPIRALASSLALLPVEGGRRIALIDRADRMSEAAQNALLKTLEEPPDRTHIILAAAEDSALMPTIRSRCATVRIGLPDATASAELLALRLNVDAPTATRLLRIAGGRPGPLITAGATGDAARAHAQIRRQLLDLIDTPPHQRLARLAPLISDAAAILAAGLDADDGDDEPSDGDTTDADAGPEAATAKAPAKRRASAKPTAAERRAAAGALLRLWRGVARDLAVVAAGADEAVAFPEDLAELRLAAAKRPPAAWVASLRSIERALTALRRNASPELLLDAVALRWSRA
jgi:DNA polymerase III delta' subunit